MKVLIIDDEPYVIDAIQLLVDWEKYSITNRFTANTVDTALEILDRERPDLAFVDVVLDDHLGSEILAHIKSKGLPTKCIVVSGHDSYDYIRAMFLLGALDYLLKPIERDAINATIEKAIFQIGHQENSEAADFSLDKKFKTLFPDHQHSLMRKLFQEKLFESAYRELCETNSVFRNASSCIVLMGYGLLLPLHLPEYPLQLSLLLSRLQYYLETENCGTIFQRATPDLDLCVLIYDRHDAVLQEIRLQLRQFNQACRPGLPLTLGCSAPCGFPEGLQTAYLQAERAAQHLPLSADNELLAYSPGMREPFLPVDLSIENRIFSALLTGDKAQMRMAIHTWIGFEKENLSPTLGCLTALCKVILALYQKSCDYLTSIYGRKIEANETKLSNFSELCTTDWKKTLLNIENHMLLLFLELQECCKDNTCHLSMRVIADWLELNYMKRIRQQDCAKLFHFNKDYMCRRFKAEYGVGMVNYLTRIRMEHAKAFLLETDMKYQEIADAVGIFDSKYFAKLFKQETGLTPAEFRQSHRERS